MAVSQLRHSPVLSVLPLAAATLALLFLACVPEATPEPDHISGPMFTQAGQQTQQPTSQAAVPDTGEQATAIPAPTPSQATARPAYGRTPAIPPKPTLAPSQAASRPTYGETPTIPPRPTLAPPQAPAEQSEVTAANRAPRKAGSSFVQVSAGPFHTCALRADSTITCWGAHGEDERLTESAGLLDSPPGGFSQVDAGHHNSCAIRQDGAVKCWGSMLIEGDDMPPEAKAMMEAMWAPPEGRFISVSAGFLFSCGVRDDNKAECWGLAASLSDALTPPAGEYTSVSVGGFHACGIRIDQTVVCWGSDQGFDGDFIGQATPPDGPFEVINAGGYHTCGFRPDGEIRCWGSIVGGYLQTCEPQPDGTNRCWTDERKKEADQAWGGGPDSEPDGNLKAMDSGQEFSCALWDGGRIGCWGSFGINDSPPPGIFEAVTVGEEHGCGLRPGGSIECWGDDTFGRASPP